MLPPSRASVAVERAANGPTHLASAVVFLVLTATGCGSGTPLGEVSGTVTYQGKPAEHLQVSFEPVAGGRRSTAVTDSSGQYALQYTRDESGALIGEHLVRLTWPARNAKDLRRREAMPIPESYNSKSEHRVTVAGGSNQFDIDIKSK